MDWPQRGGVADRLLRAFDLRGGDGDRGTRVDIVASPYQQMQRGPVFGRPICQAFAVKFLEVARVIGQDRHAAVPEYLRRCRVLRLGRGERDHGRLHLLADQVDDRLDADPPGHVADEIHKDAHAQESQQDGDAKRQVRREDALLLRAHATQDHVSEYEKVPSRAPSVN